MDFCKVWKVCGVASLLLVACDDAPEVVEEPLDYTPITEMLGGEGSVKDQFAEAFGQPLPGLTAAQLRQHQDGDAVFETTFVPAGNPLHPGLGPVYNEIGCDNCHPRDGRSSFPKQLNAPSGFFLRISQGNDPIKGPIGVEGFGGQLQQNAVAGFAPEVKFGVVYTDKVVAFADGTTVTLKKPTYSITEPYRPLPAHYELSPRIGMPVFGLGLLELIPEATILSYADADDKDGDGISGRPNYVWDNVQQKTSLGRFGWKANTASIYEQCAAAMVNDMGLTNPLFTTEDPWQREEGSRPLEISQKELDDITFYCQTLAVPTRRIANAAVEKRGEQLFNQIGCAKCHVPMMKTGKSPIPNLNEQTIHAFTDMLLHDMGGDLADGRADFLADGREWKTRPLWGLGYTMMVNGHENLLHDGRAKSIEEAILWHGGEADNAQMRYRALPKSDRDALVSFLRSL